MNYLKLPKMIISMPLAILAVVGLIFINEASFRSSTDAIADMQEAQLTRSALNDLKEIILDAETGQRGYLLTGNERYLEPYKSAIGQVNQQLDALRTIFTPYKDQMAEFTLLSRHISRKLAELDLSIRMRREGKEEAWRFVLSTDVGQDHMQAIRDQTIKLAAASIRDMEQSQAQIKQSLLLSRIGVSILAIVGLLAFYMYLLQAKALFVAGIREQELLKIERDQLDLQVRERTVSLTELATHLQGQLVAVHPVYDEAFDAFAPESVKGNPKARQKWAVQQLLWAAKASKHLGLTSSVSFPGALAWPYLYPWPQRPAGLIETAFDEQIGRADV